MFCLQESQTKFRILTREARYVASERNFADGLKKRAISVPFSFLIDIFNLNYLVFQATIFGPLGWLRLLIWAILKHPGSSRFGKEDPGYLRRCLQVIFSTFFSLNFAKKTQDI